LDKGYGSHGAKICVNRRPFVSVVYEYKTKQVCGREKSDTAQDVVLRSRYRGTDFEENKGTAENCDAGT